MVWIRDANNFILEFSLEIEVMFKKVASIVVRIHLNGQCAGDLINHIRIYGDLSVNFPFPNKSTNEDTTLVDGIFTELLHFRRIVAEVIISTVPNFDVEILFYVKLFFSEIFLQHPEEYAYLQLMHPVFYDAKQRCAFFQLNKEYVEENRVVGDAPIFSVMHDFHFMHGLGDFLVIKDLLRRHFLATCFGITLQDGWFGSCGGGGCSGGAVVMRPTHEEMDALLHESRNVSWCSTEAEVDSHIRGNHIIWFEPQFLPLNHDRCYRTFMDYLISKPYPFVILLYEYQYW
ncbi:hypothetical protein SO802_028577 [Lithocarpus litseifolius]|uniref:Maturase K n=1 Tax=Lithocarpus litseifolius TaxID=425828 RepID=A0AAW2BSJ7_9ROSI